MESLDIRNFKINSDEASFELYVGFGRWELLSFKKYKDRVGVIRLPDYEMLIEKYGREDEELAYDLEALVDAVADMMNATLNVYEAEEDENK